MNRPVSIAIATFVLAASTMGTPVRAADGFEASNLNCNITSSGFTVECWVKVRSKPGYDPRIVRCVGPVEGPCGDPSTEVWDLAVCHLSAGNCSPGKLGFAVEDGGTCYEVMSSVRVDDGGYHHVAGTYDGSFIRVFVDGVERGAVAAPGLNILVAGGKMDVGNATDHGNGLDGQIDELRVWSVARSASEIASDMGGELPVTAGMCGYWRLNGNGTDEVGGRTLSAYGGAIFAAGLYGQAADVTQGTLPAPLSCAATETLPPVIHWTPAANATSHEVLRDGSNVATVGPRDSVYVDAATLVGLHEYCVRGLVGGSPGESCCDVGGIVFLDTTALVAEWHLDGDLSDTAGGNTLGTCGPGTFVPGRVGLAADLSGCGLSAPSRPTYGIRPSGFTFETWVYLRGGASILAEMDSELSGFWWIDGLPDAGSVGRLEVRAYSLGASTGFYSNATVPMNSWHHIALRYDGSDLALYIDGVMDHIENVPGINHGNVTGSMSLGNYMDGRLDEVRLFARALDPLQIQCDALRQGNPAPPAAPGPVVASDGAACLPMELSWSDVDGETGYRVYRDGILIATTGPDVTYLQDPLSSPPGSHVYSVKAANPIGYSAAASDTGFLPFPVPAAPVLDRALSAISGVRLTWLNVPGADGYHVYRNGTLLATQAPAETTFVDLSPTSGIANYCAEAFNTCGTSPQRCLDVQSPCNPPSQTWARTIGGSAVDQFHAVVAAGDGGYVAAGSTSSFGAGSSDAFLVKVDSLGAVVWQKTYGTSQFEDAWGLDRMPDGGFILAGIANRPPTGLDFYLVRTNASGDTLWTRTYSRTGIDRCYVVRRATNGDLIVAGTRGTRLGVMRMNGTGDTLWTRLLGSMPARSYKVDARETADLGLVFSYFGNDDQGQVVRTDAAGNRLWESATSTHESIAEVPGGGFVVAGNSNYGGEMFERLDPLGNILWSQYLDLAPTLHAVLPLPEGGFVAAGEGGGCGDLSGSWPVMSLGRADAHGNPTSTSCVVDSGLSTAQALVIASDGGLVLAGARTLTGSASGFDGYLVKRECGEPATTAIGDQGRPLPKRVALAAPWPNPTRGAVYYQIALPHAMRVRVSLHDISGRLVRTFVDQEMTPGVHAMGVELGAGTARVGPGVYYLRLVTAATTETRTLVILR